MNMKVMVTKIPWDPSPLINRASHGCQGLQAMDMFKCLLTQQLLQLWWTHKLQDTPNHFIVHTVAAKALTVLVAVPKGVVVVVAAVIVEMVITEVVVEAAVRRVAAAVKGRNARHAV